MTRPTERPATYPASKPKGLKKLIRWVLLSVGGLLAALTVMILAAVLFGIPLEFDRVKSKIETAATQALGRSVSIEGPFTLVPSMPPAVQIEGVQVGNPPGWPEGDLVRLHMARVKLRILPLLKGEILIEEITVDGLQVNLETNAEGVPNWLLAQGARGRAAEPEPEAPSEPPALRFIELADLSLRDIALIHKDAVTGQTFELTLEEISGSALDREPMTLLIKGRVQDIPYEVTLDGGSLASLVGGEEAWPLDFSASAVGATLRVGGTIAEPLRGRGLALDFEFTGPRMKDLEAILGTTLPPIQSFGLEGRIEELDGRYRIAEITGEVAAVGVTGGFEADISGDRPRLTGAIDIATIDAGPLFAAIDAEGKVQSAGDPQPGQDPREPPEQEVKEAGEGRKTVDLDEPVLTLEPLKRFDAQFELRIHEVVNAPVSLRDASLEVTVSDGALRAPIELNLAQVPFHGEFSLAPEDGRPQIAISLAADKSDIGELAGLVSGATGIEGGFDKAYMGLTAGGETLRSLVETAELRFSMSGAALSYGHEEGGRPVEFALDEANLVFPAAHEAQVTARGSVLGEGFSLDLGGGTFIDNFVKKTWPLKLNARGGGGELRIDGIVRNAEAGEGTDLAFALTGEKLGGLAVWVGVPPDATQSYALRGTVSLRTKGPRIRLDEVRIGKSSFAGDVGLRKDADAPVTFIALQFDVLDFKGMASLFPEQPKSEESAPKERTEGPEALTIDVPILPNGIEIFDSDIDIAIARIKMEPVDVTDIALSSKIRGGYVDEAPLTATFGGARFEGRFAADFRGQVPKIDLLVKSTKVNVGSLLGQLGVADGLDLSAGGFSLDLAMEGASARQVLERSAFSVAITDGVWRFSAPGAGEGFDIRVPNAKIVAEPGKPIALEIDGLIRKTPVGIKLTTDSLASFAVRKKRLKMDLDVALAKASLRLSGSAPLPVRADNLHFAMDLSGNRFSDFDELLDVSLPPIGPYQLKGDFGSRKSGYYLERLNVVVGTSSLTGKLDFTTTEQPPLLDVGLVAERIQLDDFDTGDWSASEDRDPAAAEGPPEDAEGDPESPAGGRPLLSPEVMRSLNARLDVRVDEVLSGQDPLGRGTLEATLKDGRFQIDPLTLEVPGGSVDVGFALEPTASEVRMEARAKVERLDYGILARRIDPASQTGGLIALDLDLKTRGPDLERVMQGANGHLDFGVWPKDLNAGIFDLWAVNVISALMSEVDKNEASKVNCVIVRFQIKDGVMHERVLFADTSKMRVEGSAEIDFKRRTLDVRAAPKAKRPEFFSLAVPVGLSGEFDDFGIDVNPVILTAKAVSFVTSPLHVPLRRIFKRGVPENGAQACTAAWIINGDPGDLPASAPEPEPGQGGAGSRSSRSSGGETQGSGAGEDASPFGVFQAE